MVAPATYEYGIDYYRFSVDYNVPLADILPKHPAFAPKQRDVPNLPFYDHVFPLTSGRIDWKEGDERQKKLVTLGGDDLRTARIHKFDEQLLVAYTRTLPGYHATRIDLAADLLNGDFCDPLAVLLAFMQGRCTTAARSCNRVDNWTKDYRVGITVYIGSRESMTFLRVYDKGKQLGLKTPWTRLELECKGDYAGRIADAVADHGVILTTKEAVRGFIKTGIEWFDNAGLPETPALLIAAGERKQTSFERWIETTVLPAIARALRENTPGFRDKLMDLLNRTN